MYAAPEHLVNGHWLEPSVSVKGSSISDDWWAMLSISAKEGHLQRG